MVAYVAISIPVIGEGLPAQLSSLKPRRARLAAVVAALAMIVLVLLARRRMALAPA